jgi:MerR family copper efflux transcriptional regulator
MKNQDKLTIGQLAKRVGLRTSALRYYEEQGLLVPVDRTSSGYRLYAPDAEQTLHFIQRAQRLGFSLADIHTLLKGWQTGDLSMEDVVQSAEDRYFALEKQLTERLVLRHEMGLFMQDIYQRLSHGVDTSAGALFNQLLERVCVNPLNQPAETMLDWLVEYSDCRLTSDEGKKILDDLENQHVHVWKEADAYHILVISDDPGVKLALEALADLEAGCQAHAHSSQAPELSHNREGYLLTAKGENGFIYARLFLSL